MDPLWRKRPQNTLKTGFYGFGKNNEVITSAEDWISTPATDTRLKLTALHLMTAEVNCLLKMLDQWTLYEKTGLRPPPDGNVAILTVVSGSQNFNAPGLLPVPGGN
ncbi:uncharacterized protein LOC144580887 isoform X1 [Callithrix jacchus]